MKNICALIIGIGATVAFGLFGGIAATVAVYYISKK